MEKNTEDKGGDCYEIYTVNDNVTKDDDDCYEIDTVNFCPKLNINVSKDVVLVAERGPVALKDFPHPRYLCCNFPFATTSHESYCSMCFCCVCEIAAPCLQCEGFNGHCNVNRQKELQWGKEVETASNFRGSSMATNCISQVIQDKEQVFCTYGYQNVDE